MGSIESLLLSLARMNPARFVITLAMAFGAYYFFIFDGGARYDIRLKKLKEDTKKEAEIAQKTEALLAERETILRTRDQLAAQFRKSLQALPPEIDVAELVRGVNLTAKSAGVKINTIRPSRIRQEEFYDELPIDIEAQGKFGDLTLFLSYIARMPRIVRVTAVKVRLANRREEALSSGDLFLESTLAGYRSRPIDLAKLREQNQQKNRNNRGNRR